MNVYSDGSFCRKSRAAGVGVYFKTGQAPLVKEMRMSQAFANVSDNNHAETLAVVFAVKQVVANQIKGSLTIITDSDHVYEVWSGVKSACDKQLPLFKLLRELSLNFEKFNMTVTKGHSGLNGIENEQCDRLAKQAMRAMRDNRVTPLGCDTILLS